jgi:hypothetical protein
MKGDFRSFGLDARQASGRCPVAGRGKQPIFSVRECAGAGEGIGAKSAAAVRALGAKKSWTNQLSTGCAAICLEATENGATCRALRFAGDVLIG